MARGSSRPDAGSLSAIAALLGSMACSAPIQIERLQEIGCEEWVVPAHPRPSPTGLPSTPEILWTWDPATDPLVLATPDITGAPQLDEVTIGPSGDLWVIAPTDGEITHLSREGAALQVHHAFSALEHETRFADIRVSPEGAAYVGSRGLDAAMRVYSPEGRQLYTWPSDTEFSTGASFGPHGRVYVGDFARNGLAATCRGDPARIQWVARTDSFGQLWADERGDMLFRSIRAPDVVALHEDGAISPVVSSGVPPRAPTDVEVSVYGMAGDAYLVSHYVRGDSSADVFLFEDSDLVWTEAVQVDGGVEHRMDPAGGVWRQRGSSLVRTLHGSEAFSVDDFPCVIRSASFGSDGSVVCSRWSLVPGREGPTDTLVRISPVDGRILWEVDLAPTEEGSIGLIAGPDLDGRMYVTLGFDVGRRLELVALQTDALPPSGSYCGALGVCNRHDSGWSLDYRAR